MSSSPPQLREERGQNARNEGGVLGGRSCSSVSVKGEEGGPYNKNREGHDAMGGMSPQQHVLSFLQCPFTRRPSILLLNQCRRLQAPPPMLCHMCEKKVYPLDFLSIDGVRREQPLPVAADTISVLNK